MTKQFKRDDKFNKEVFLTVGLIQRKILSIQNYIDEHQCDLAKDLEADFYIIKRETRYLLNSFRTLLGGNKDEQLSK